MLLLFNGCAALLHAHVGALAGIRVGMRRGLCLLLLAVGCGSAERDSGSADGCGGPWYYDGDQDGFGDPAVTDAGCEAPAGHVAQSGDCADADAGRHPGADETCNTVDDDCDGIVDEDALDGTPWYPDADGDGYGDEAGAVSACTAPVGLLAEGGDCDDTTADVNPGAREACNEVDDDCDGETDEGPDALDATPWYADADGDGEGDPAVVVEACEAPEGHVATDTDCDDTDPAVSMGATEICDGIDNDCDTTVDDDATLRPTWYFDHDGDGHGTATATLQACQQPVGYDDDDTDCDDDDATVSPDAAERCGGADEDCDGTVDEDDAADAEDWFVDADADGWGDSATARTACAAAAGEVAEGGDCDDADATLSPGADENCGGGDEDCDGAVDEGDATDATAWYADADGDGYGDGAATLACDAPADSVADDGDCDDADAAVSPAAPEVCTDGVDDDCDGEADDGCSLEGAFTAADADLTFVGAPSTTVGRDGLWIADLDGDGVGTLVVGTTYGEDVGGSHSGSVYLLDGAATGSVTAADAVAIFGADGVGYALGDPVLAGDQTGDGVTDLFAVGAMSGSLDCRGGVLLLDGAATSTVSLSCADAGLFGDSSDGREVVGPVATPDLDGDGTPDLAGWLDDDLFVEAGPVLSWGRARSAGVIVTDAAFTRPETMAAGDFDGDGRDELVYGASDQVWRCAAPVSAGSPAAAGCVVAASEATSASWSFGATVTGLGDADGDGLQDGLLVGAPAYDAGGAGTDGGTVLLFTGLLTGQAVTDAVAAWDGAVTADQLGRDGLFAPGDVDGDGSADVGLSQRWTGAWLDYDVTGHSGAVTDADVAFTGPDVDYTGWSAAAGDLDGDGVVDLATSAIWDSTGGSYAGAVYVVLGP